MLRVSLGRLQPLLFAVVAFAVAQSGAVAQPQLAEAVRPRSVLVLFSQRNTAPVVPRVEAAFRETLEASLSEPIDFNVEHLDLPEGIPSPHAERIADLLREKYASRQLDLIATYRAEALSFLLARRATLFPGVPVVAIGDSRRTLDSLKAPPDVVPADLPAAEQRTVAVALALHPGTERVVIVGGASSSDLQAAAYATRLSLAAAPEVDVISLAGLPLQQQLGRITTLPPHSLIIFTSYRGDTMGRSTVASDMLRVVARAATAPTYGAADTFLGLGIVGGDLIQYANVGRRGAEVAAATLTGQPVVAVSPDRLPASLLMFDWRELRRWHIDESRLPAGSQVLFREFTVWERYRGVFLAIFAVLVVQGLAIGGLLVERRTRRMAQADLAMAEHRYRTVADHTSDWEYWVAPDGTFVYISPSCAAVTGYEAAEFARRPALIHDIIFPEDREIWDQHCQDVLAGASHSRLEFRIVTASGETRWVEHVCSRVVGEDGRDLGVRGSNRDVTERKRAVSALHEALEEVRALRDRLEVDNSYMREQLQSTAGLEGLAASSNVMQYVLAKIRQVAPTSSTVLLLGETGVGKSLVAQMLHDLGPRRSRPLITLNCASLPPTLVESELFGHERGAFTGAHTMRRGRFELADGSTLFLDEIGDLPLELQGKLLRAIQDGQFERVGGSQTLHTDARLIAATNRKLEDDVRVGRFRQDLWYRLSVFPVTIPPLRQRTEDIPQLVHVFLEKHCRRMGKPLLQVSKATMRALQSREWPGNVRELENVVERGVISSTGALLEIVSDESPSLGRPPVASDGGADCRTLTQVERDHIVATLERVEWRVGGEGGAAAALAINASTLRSRMRKLGIERPPTSSVGG